jgi:hypothetical protein
VALGIIAKLAVLADDLAALLLNFAIAGHRLNPAFEFPLRRCGCKQRSERLTMLFALLRRSSILSISFAAMLSRVLSSLDRFLSSPASIPGVAVQVATKSLLPASGWGELVSTPFAFHAIIPLLDYTNHSDRRSRFVKCEFYLTYCNY